MSVTRNREGPLRLCLWDPEVDELVKRHTGKMDERPYPHAGWAECRCALARQIRALMGIPERPAR